MSWFLVDDGIDDSPELLAIPARYRMGAFGLWTAVGVWMSKQQELFCPMEVVKKLGGTALLANELHNCGLLLWEARPPSGGLAYTGRRCSVKAPEAAQAAREATAERVRRHRANKKKGANQGEPPAVTPLPEVTPNVTERYPAPREGKVRLGGSEACPVPDLPKPPLTKSGTALARASENHSGGRPLDRMGRPAMGFNAMLGNEIVLDPPPVDRHVSTGARDLVKAAMPERMWQSARDCRQGLEVEADKLLKNAAIPEILAGAVEEYVGLLAAGEDKYPGHLKHIYGRKLAERTARPQRPLGASERKGQGWDALREKEKTPPQMEME